MNQEIKKRWVEALRSGKYKQGRCMLQNGDEFCCLGVLVDIQGAACGDRAIPATEHWAGLSYLQLKVLTAANDGGGFCVSGGEGALLDYRNMDQHTFAQIADYIERYL